MISSKEQDVERFDTIRAVLPLAVHHNAWLLVHPRQKVVLVAVVHRIRRGRGRRLGGDVVVQLVPIVTDGDLELHSGINRADHGRRVERGKQFVLAAPKERENPFLINYLDLFVLRLGEVSEGHLHLNHHTATVRHALNLVSGGWGKIVKHS